ncbi:MAG: hypothetical protein ACF8XB_01690 [Planctomycetota bacterium JB042]
MNERPRLRRWGGLAILGAAAAVVPGCGLLCTLILLLAALAGQIDDEWFEFFQYQASVSSLAGSSSLTGGGAAGDVLEVLGKKEGGQFDFRSKVPHEGTFDACLTVGVQNPAAHVPLSTRALLTVAPIDSPPSGVDGFALEATSGGVESAWSVRAVDQGSWISGAVSIPLHETIVLRIEQTPSARRFHVATETDAAKGTWTPVHQVAAGPPEGLRVFGGSARGMAKNGGFLFHSLRIGGVEFGGEAEVPVVAELGAALDRLRTARDLLGAGVEGAAAAEAELETALVELADAADALASATLSPKAEGKLAAKALKRARSKAKGALKKADKVVTKGKGSTKKARKKANAAISRATLAIGNLLGVKSKKASASLADAITVGSEE